MNPSSGGDGDECHVPALEMCPAVNVPERILIVLDRGCDEVFTYFEIENDQKVRPLQAVKRALGIFVQNKHAIDKKHHFALAVLDECTTTWVQNFTYDVSKILGKIDKVEECPTEDVFNMNTLFEVIGERVALPRPPPGGGGALAAAPPYVVRVVLVYGRSVTVPELVLGPLARLLLGSPYLTFDVVMHHEPPDSSNRCRLIAERLRAIAERGPGVAERNAALFFAVGRNALRLHRAMARLAGHPLQRRARWMRSLENGTAADGPAEDGPAEGDFRP